MQAYLRNLIVPVMLTLFLSPLAYLAAKPDKKAPTPQKPAMLPQIDGPSNWGQIQQDRRRITVAGHHQWRVEHGEIRPDGKLLVYWIENSTGAVGPGLYEIHADGSITGKWGWSEDGAKQDAKGNWQGLDRHDTLRVAAKPDA